MNYGFIVMDEQRLSIDHPGSYLVSAVVATTKLTDIPVLMGWPLPRSH